MFIEPLTFRRWRRVPPRQSLWTRNNRIRNPPIRRNKGQPMWRPAWREFVSVEPQSDRNAQPTCQRLKTQLPPVKPTDASKHDVVHYSGHIDLGGEMRFVRDGPAGTKPRCWSGAGDADFLRDCRCQRIRFSLIQSENASVHSEGIAYPFQIAASGGLCCL